MLKFANSYSYSIDNEPFIGEFDSKDEAMKEALMYSNNVTIGENYKFVPTMPSAESVLECIREELDDDTCGEMDTYLLNVSAEEMSLLDKMLLDTFYKWAEETKHTPDFLYAEEFDDGWRFNQDTRNV